MSSTRALVAYATEMGSTREIAEAIGDEIARTGIEVDVVPAAGVTDVRPYQAVVVGSALYMGRWRRPAVLLLKRHTAVLRDRRVWLFHSGPIGKADQVEAQRAPANVRKLAARIGADQPVTFGGLLDPARANGFIARKMAAGPLAGDYRDWDRIRAWAGTIAAEIPVDRARG